MSTPNVAERLASRPLWVDATASGEPRPSLAAAQKAEDLGVGRLWIPEGAHDPFLQLVRAADRTRRLELATGVAIAFARTPMTLAYASWALQEASSGRAVIGLGSQIKAHIERRYAMSWSRPAARMREFVQATRAIWHSWQTGERLRFEGEFYSHTLMPLMFAPQPLPAGPPPLVLAGFGPRMVEVAGEVGDGFLCHPFGSVDFLREHLAPVVEAARARSETSGEPWTTRPFELNVGVLVATGRTEEELAAAVVSMRERIAFYASTPAYAAILEHHGWGELPAELHRLSTRGEWAQMGRRIDDEMLATFAVIGEPQVAARELVDRYAGLADRVTVYGAAEGSDAATFEALVAANELAAPALTSAGAEARAIAGGAVR